MTTAEVHGTDLDDRSVRSWVQGAELVGATGLAGDLLGAAPHLAGSGDRARLALLDGRPADALALLAQTGLDVVPASGPGSADHVVALASRAALGDGTALGVLLSWGSTTSDPQVRRLFLRLLAVAAPRGRHHGLADDAWRSLVVEHGDRTPQGLAGWAAAQVTARDATRGADALQAVLGAAHVLRRAAPSAADDATATEIAVRDLRARGDDAGAALLAAAVARTGRASADLQALRDATALRERRAAAVVPLLAVVLLLPLGIVGIAAALGVVHGLRRAWRRIPAVRWADEQVWYAVDGVRPDDGRGLHGRSDVRPAPAIAAAVGFIVGVALAVQADTWARALVPGLGDGWAMLLWAVPLLGTPVGAFLLVERLRMALVRRRLAQQEAADHAALLASAGSCRCWDTVAAVGPFADAYLAQHLGPALVPHVPGAPPGASMRRCPLSGVPWLVTTTTGARATLALRGAPPLAADPAAAGVGGYL